MGLTKFSETMDSLYPELVREFFASVELMYKKPRIPKPDERVLKFVCNGYAFSLTIAEVCEIYGFRYGSETKFGDFTSSDSFWNTIAKENANGILNAKKNPKFSLIRNPAIRYIHRLLGNTFFARKQFGGVRQDELWLLFMDVRRYIWWTNIVRCSVMLRSKTSTWVATKNQSKGSSTANILYWLNFSRTQRMRGNIAMCTPIAKHEKRSFPLPNTDLTSVTSLANIFFKHKGEDLFVLVPKSKRGKTEELETDEPQAVSDLWELPELPFEPKLEREKIFYNAYKIQKTMNKMAKNKFNWIKSKLRKISSYVSDEDEFIAQEEGRAIDRDQEAHGEQLDGCERRSSYDGNPLPSPHLPKIKQRKLGKKLQRD
ncbi:hypothetical protein ISN45_Aa01g027530 [Arabidopsis thaliana x Arabidopsis arenosa]|uniref:Arabidopsis retrotransposon Orf1 C-terminal domain-containing protein n=1 Tax=Arabidopsis thaliana x Arabidopsis arenosa TaxID=1240361 RepID=A0A8T2C7E3_9BRAS|nr:hypothetical protein ISN45_Aa01g027530 [Arabidopsis thaliana x Arabidopsis arenosa]